MTLCRLELIWGLVLCAVATAAWRLLDGAVRGTRRGDAAETGTERL